MSSEGSLIVLVCVCVCAQEFCILDDANNDNNIWGWSNLNKSKTVGRQAGSWTLALLCRKAMSVTHVRKGEKVLLIILLKHDHLSDTFPFVEVQFLQSPNVVELCHQLKKKVTMTIEYSVCEYQKHRHICKCKTVLTDLFLLENLTSIIRKQGLVVAKIKGAE